MVTRHPFSKACLQHSQTVIQPCMWFMEEPSQFSVGQTAQSLTCSIMDKPHTGLEDCLRMLLSCFRKRMPGGNEVTSASKGLRCSDGCAMPTDRSPAPHLPLSSSFLPISPLSDGRTPFRSSKMNALSPIEPSNHDALEFWLGIRQSGSKETE